MAAQQQPEQGIGNQFAGGPGPKRPPNNPATGGQAQEAPIGNQQPGGPGGGTVVGITGTAQPIAPVGQTQGGPLLGNQFAQPSASAIDTSMFGQPITAATYQAPTVNERVVDGPQIDYGQYNAFTREMTDEELTSSQLQGLLESDSPYMRQAALAGQRMAAQRGALSSSISAGASQASAIQAALPIASADAQAYQRMATENAAAINSMSIAKLESATNMATSKLASLTSLATTAMDAETQSNVAALNANFQSRIEADKAKRQRENNVFEATFNQSQELLRQSGALQLEGVRGQNSFTLEAMRQAGMVDLEGIRQQGALTLEGVRQEGALTLEGVRQEGALTLEGVRQEGAMDRVEAERQARLDEISARGTVDSVLADQDFQNELILQDAESIDNIIMSLGMAGYDPEQFIVALNAAFGIRDRVFSGDEGEGGG